MSNSCGCGGDSPNKTEKKMLLVEATGESPSTCGLPGLGESQTSGCANQDPTFDSINSEFVVPSVGSAVTIQVCNPSVYSVGQWIQFFGYTLTMQIIAITGSNIQIRNGCPGGIEIDSNPNAGLLIPRLTRFNVVDQPDCMSEADKLEQILDALSQADEICTPNLLEGTPTAEVQPVAVTINDPNNTGFGRCIRRIFGFLMKAGTPIFSQLQTVAWADLPNYRRLGHGNSNNEVRKLPNPGENPNLTAGMQYMSAYKAGGAEYPVGPVYGFRPLSIELLNNPSNPLGTSGATAPANATVYNNTFNLGIQPDITSVLRNQDHYWVLCHVEIGLTGSMASTKVMSAKVNGELACTTHGFNDSSTNVNSRNSATIPVRVDAANNNLTLLIEQSLATSSNYIARLFVRGIWF